MPNLKRHAALAPLLSVTSLVVLAVFLAPCAIAATNLSILPGAAETAGQNGAYFSSTLWITNISTDTVNVSIGLIPAGGTAPAPVSFTFPPGRTQRFLRALSTLFGPNVKSGTITVSADGNLALQLVTQNIADPKGTYGLALSPVAENDLLTAGKTGHAIWVSQSADSSKGYRTNVAAALVDKDTSIEVRVFDDAGNLKGTRSVGTATPASWQESVASIAGADLPRGRVEIKVLTGRATGYTAVVDNITGDGIASQTVALSPTVNDLLLDGVARTPGANGTHWSTDVRLFNPNASPLTVTLDAIGFASGPASILRTIPANGLVEIQDVLAAFGMPDGVAGALRLHAASPFLTAGRTNNSDPTGQRPGTISAYQQPIPFPSGLISAPDTGVFSGLDYTTSNPGFRSNLAILGGPSGGSGHMTLASSTGTPLVTSSFSVPPNTWGQQPLPNWFSGASIPTGARVDITLEQGSVDAYVSRIDNGTGDAVVLRFTTIPVCPLPTLTLSAPAVVCAGQSAMLSWQATPADAVVSIDGIGSNLPASGSAPISGATATYTGRATSKCGTSADATASVVAGLAPVIKSFTASPTAVAPGQPVTLTLVSENGLSAVVDPGQVAIPLNGSVTVTPEGTMSVTYQVTVTGACDPIAQEHVIVPIGNPDITLVSPDITSSVVRTATYGRVTFVIRNKGFTPTFAPVTLKVSLDPAAMVRYQSILMSATDPGWSVVQAIPGGSLVFTLQTDQPIAGMGKTTVSVLLGFPEGQSSMGTFTSNMATVSTDRDSNLSNNTAAFSVTTTP